MPKSFSKRILNSIRLKARLCQAKHCRKNCLSLVNSKNKRKDKKKARERKTKSKREAEREEVREREQERMRGTGGEERGIPVAV